MQKHEHVYLLEDGATAYRCHDVDCGNEMLRDEQGRQYIRSRGEMEWRLAEAA